MGGLNGMMQQEEKTNKCADCGKPIAENFTHCWKCAQAKNIKGTISETTGSGALPAAKPLNASGKGSDIELIRANAYACRCILEFFLKEKGLCLRWDREQKKFLVQPIK